MDAFSQAYLQDLDLGEANKTGQTQQAAQQRAREARLPASLLHQMAAPASETRATMGTSCALPAPRMRWYPAGPAAGSPAGGHAAAGRQRSGGVRVSPPASPPASAQPPVAAIDPLSVCLQVGCPACPFKGV